VVYCPVSHTTENLFSTTRIPSIPDTDCDARQTRRPSPLYYQAQFEYAGHLNLDKIAYHLVAQPQRRYSSRLLCTFISNVSDTNYATFRYNSEYNFQI